MDPIALEPVDEVVITTLVDNSYDALMATPARPTARRCPGSPVSTHRSSRRAAAGPDRRKPPPGDVGFRDRRHPHLPAGSGAAGQRRRPTQPDADPAVQRVSARWSELTTALVGIGALEPSPLLAQSGNGVAEAGQEALLSLGAVRDVCLRFFDEWAPLSNPSSTRK